MKSSTFSVLPLILIALALAPVVSAAQSKFALRAQDLKTLVEKNNERVRAKAAETDGALKRTGTFARSFFPTLELRASQESFKKGPLPTLTQPELGAEIKMNLFNGGRDRIENDHRDLLARRKRFEAAQTFSTELAKARESYWQALHLRESIEVIKETRKSCAETLRTAERRIRSGVATDSDRVEFEMQDSELKIELERSELEYKNRIRTLRVAVGLAEEAEIDLNEEFRHEHEWETALRHGEDDHAFLVKPAEIQAEESLLQARSQERLWLPKLEAYAAFHQFNQRAEPDYSDATDRRETVLGLRLTMGIFDGLAGAREASALRADAMAATAEARYAHQEVEAHLHGEISELKLLHQQVHEAEENIRRAEKYYRLTQSEYQRGVKNSPDMLGALEKLFAMKRKRLEIVRDFQISKSHVLAKIGR